MGEVETAAEVGSDEGTVKVGVDRGGPSAQADLGAVVEAGLRC